MIIKGWPAADSAGTFEILDHEANMPEMVESTTVDPTQDEGFSGDADIGNFLSRQTELATFEWNPGNAIDVSYDVWSAFLNNPAVTDKLNNYKLIRADMVLTFSINGTPFHAGKVLVAWKYMDKFNEDSSVAGRVCQYTQLDQHLWLDAPTGKAGCLCIPFVFPENYLPLQGALYVPGSLKVISPTTLLQNDSGTDPVSITIFAHLKNVKLTVPTTRGAAFSAIASEKLDLPILGYEAAKRGKKMTAMDNKELFPKDPGSDPEDEGEDEYEQAGPIEKTAASVATTAQSLSHVPIIGPFASAVDIGASAVAGIANIFGWSKPRIIDDPKVMRNTPLANLASGDGGSQCQSLALTQKQGITVDPGVCNESSEDTLTVAHLSQRESLYTNFTWDVTDDVNDYIFATQVTPCLYQVATVGVGNAIIPTATHYASLPAGYWGGSLKFRFQFVCSGMHKGKVAIAHDPSGLVSGTYDIYNTTRCTVVNLAEHTDITIVVPWAQSTTFLPTDRLHENIATPLWTASTPETMQPLSQSNGVLYMKVVNKLTVSDGATPVRVLVSVSACEDFKLGNTLGVPETICYKTAAGESQDLLELPLLRGFEASMNVDKSDVLVNDSPVADPSTVHAMADTKTTDHTFEVFFGEPYLSIRPLLKRACMYRVQKVSETSSSTAYALYYQDLPSVPLYRGYVPDAIDRNAANTDDYNQVFTTPYNYTAQMYAGWRGSIRYTMTPMESTSGSALFVIRNIAEDFVSSDVDPIPSNSTFAMTTTIQTAAERISQWIGTCSGMFGTNRNMLNADIEIPYAKRWRYSLTNVDNSSADNNYGSAGYLWRWMYSSGTTFHPATTFLMSTSCGEDIQFVGFAGTPVYYVNQGN